MEENQKVFLNLEKMVYGMFIMLTIVLITFLSYLTGAKFGLCLIALVLEILCFYVIKKNKNSNKIEELIKDNNKINTLKKTVYSVFAVFAAIFVVSLIYAIINMADSNIMSLLTQLLSVNILSIVIFLVLIFTIFFISRQEKETSEVESAEINQILKSKSSKKLSSIVYGLFLVISCVIPFIYVYFFGDANLKTVIWVIGCLSNLIFGVLTSAILRCVRKYDISYKLLALAILVVCLMGIFSQVSSIISAYIWFIVTLVISLLTVVFYDKYSKFTPFVLLIIAVAMTVLQIAVF